MSLRISEVYERKPDTNPRSSSAYYETDKLIGFEVSGGLWGRARFRTEAAAELDKEIKESIDRKFPPGCFEKE